jgi:hypothetical protein
VLSNIPILSSYDSLLGVFTRFTYLISGYAGITIGEAFLIFSKGIVSNNGRLTIIYNSSMLMSDSF